MLRRGPAIALGLVALAAGCGESEQAATTAATTTAPGPPTPAPEELRGYFARMNPIRARIDPAAAAAGNALQGLSNEPGPSWAAAERRVRNGEAVLRKTARELEVMAVPIELRREHNGYVEGVRRVADIFEDVLVPLEQRDAVVLQRISTQTPKRLQESRALVDAWRIAVEAAADRAGVKVPAWVSQTGSGSARTG